MSRLELKSKIFSIVERHSADDAWLARIYEILASGEKTGNNWWKELSSAQQHRIDESMAAANRGEVISNDEVLDNF
jgi:predicted transcriptional regulator